MWAIRSTSCSAASDLRPQLGVGRLGRGRSEPELHAGEGRPELVRRVRDELALRLHGALDPVGHVVERLAELLQLVAAADGAGARAQVAAAQPAGRLGEPRERPRQGAREHEGQDQAGQQPGHGDHGDAQGGARHVALHVFDVA